MSIALSTLLLFLLLIPGIAFRNAYGFGELSIKRVQSSAFDDFIWAIIPGVAFQFFGLLFIQHYQQDYIIDISLLLKLLNNTQTIEEANYLQQNLDVIFLYNIILTSFAGLCGYFSRKIIKYLNFDHYFKFLRFNNDWYYLLRGEFIFFGGQSKRKAIDDDEKGLNKLISYIDVWLSYRWSIFKEFICDRHRIAFCVVNAVVKTDEGACYIYSGIIHSFTVNKNGELALLKLVAVERTRFYPEERKSENPSAIYMESGMVAIKGEHIIDIRVEPVKQKDLSKKV